MSEIREKIRSFVVNNFLFGEGEGLTEETSFLQEGIIDSTGILELVEFIETEFSVSIRDDELIPENLDSIRQVERYLTQKLGPRQACEAPLPLQAGA